jgi:hypothetical protein
MPQRAHADCLPGNTSAPSAGHWMQAGAARRPTRQRYAATFYVAFQT